MHEKDSQQNMVIKSEKDMFSRPVLSLVVWYCCCQWGIEGGVFWFRL